MINLGMTQTLEIVKTTDFGVYLNTPSGNENQKVLLPKRQVPEHSKIGDTLNVFIYKDSEDRIIATTTTPLITLNSLAVLDVIDVTTIGAFLNWGLAKDLLLPFKEQTIKVQTGDKVLVSLYIDKSSRLCATMKVYELLSLESPYEKDALVNGTVYDIAEDFGAYVAVDNLYSAMIPKKELFRNLKIGETIQARVSSVKEDGKLDLSLQKKSYIQMDEDSEFIFNKLTENGGYLPYHDKSDSNEIKDVFHLSKNAFKRAIGRLFKEGKIIIEETGIRIK